MKIHAKGSSIFPGVRHRRWLLSFSLKVRSVGTSFFLSSLNNVCNFLIHNPNRSDLRFKKNCVFGITSIGVAGEADPSQLKCEMPPIIKP